MCKGTVTVSVKDAPPTGWYDNGTAYAAQIRTKPYTFKSLAHRFGVRAAVLLAKAVTGAASST